MQKGGIKREVRKVVIPGFEAVFAIAEKKIGIAGLAIFCVGLGLLFFVFYLAYQPFQDPTMLTFVKTSPAGGEGKGRYSTGCSPT